MSRSLHKIAAMTLVVYLLVPSIVLANTEQCSSHASENHPSIRDCAKNDNLEISLYGNGTTTSHADLELTCKESGQTTETQVKTVCISTKTKKPPPPKEIAEKENIHYKLAGPASQKLVTIVNAAKSLYKQGKFDKVPFPAERRQNTITQLAIWKHMSTTRGAKAEDKISKESVESDMMRQAKFKRSDLSATENEKLDRSIEEILGAVDLTLKQSETPPSPEEKKDETQFSGVVVPDEPEPKHNKEDCQIPKFSVFECNNPKYQDMMTCENAYIPCPCPLATSAAVPPSGVLPNTLPAQPQPAPTQDCCIRTVTVTNDFNQPIVYQLSNDEVPINSAATAFPKILAESNFVQPGASTMLGEIRQKCVFIVAYVPGGTTMYKYCCDGVGTKQVSTNLPGLKSFTVETIACTSAIPVIPVPTNPTPPTNTPPSPTPSTPGQPAPTPPPAPTTAPTTPPPTNTTPVTGAGNAPKTPGGTGGTPGRTATPTNPPATGGGGGAPPIMPPPMKPPGKKEKSDTKDDKSCTIRSLNFSNDYKLPVKYVVYHLVSSTDVRQILKTSDTIAPGKTVTISGDFGSSVRVAAIKLETKDGKELATSLSIQDFACEHPGQTQTISDYDAFKRVIMTAGQ